MAGWLGERLLCEMRQRIDAIEAGTAVPQAAVRVADLRIQHRTRADEFEGYFLVDDTPAILWAEAIAAVREIALIANEALQFFGRAGDRNASTPVRGLVICVAACGAGEFRR